ncbi:hypothetical protein [Kineococcus gypseus]|uniref:hypothetical protein n=1 Tax=Kineococcus gypseus TaxID=1637102 RepID=UPI003D7E364B
MPHRPEPAAALPPDAPAPADAAGGGASGWLHELLHRGRCPDPSAPWRPGPAPAARAAAARQVREGLLQRVVGDVVVAAGVPVDAGVRAAALALLLPAEGVVVGAAAAWVHVGAPLPPPREVLLARRSAARHQPRGGVRLTTSRARLDAADVVRVGALRVSSPARTLLDVARSEPRRAARLRELLGAAGLSTAEVEQAARRARGLAHVRAARRALAGAGPGPAVGAGPAPQTRYASKTPSTRRTAAST